MVKSLLEIACFQAEHVSLAAAAGADRIEYCDQYALGGITPPLAGFEALKKSVHVPIYVMIRSRGGDFVYSNVEIKQMQQQMADFKQAGADGFVFGALLPHNRLDLFALEKLAMAAAPLPYTFHRAFDLLSNPEAALEVLATHDCSNILSSGGSSNALAGQQQLQQWASQVAGRIRILAGGGIRAENMIELQSLSSLLDFHSAALVGNKQFSSREVQRMKALLQG